MKIRFSFPGTALIFLVFFILVSCASAQNIISGNNENTVSLISYENEDPNVNDDKADPTGQSIDNGLYIYRPNYILGFSPFTKGFWKLSRFGYYSWVYNLYDYTLNNYYDYYNRSLYGGWLYGKMNIYTFNGWNNNQTQFYSAGYFSGLYGMNGHIIYKPLVALKNTNVNVPLTTANNFFFTRLFKRNKITAKYSDSFDDKLEKKPKPVNISENNSVPVLRTDDGSLREAKKINYYYKTKYDDYYNSLNRNFSNGNNNQNIYSGLNSAVNSTVNNAAIKNNAGKGSYSRSNPSGSSITGSTTGSTVTNNQGSKSNSSSDNSSGKQANTGNTKK